MSSIYDQHDRAFKHVSAYVILKGNERVATIAFKYPRDGAGRTYAYVHWLGVSMVRGHASGCGYDKHSAACSVAVRNLKPRCATERHNDAIAAAPFIAALEKDGGWTWDRCLADAGFTVLQAV
jgi:hypothetical protein